MSFAINTQLFLYVRGGGGIARITLKILGGRRIRFTCLGKGVSRICAILLWDTTCPQWKFVHTVPNDKHYVTVDLRNASLIRLHRLHTS